MKKAERILFASLAAFPTIKTVELTLLEDCLINHFVKDIIYILQVPQSPAAWIKLQARFKRR